jgi:hypothetical protein
MDRTVLGGAGRADGVARKQKIDDGDFGLNVGNRSLRANAQALSDFLSAIRNLLRAKSENLWKQKGQKGHQKGAKPFCVFCPFCFH